MKLTYKQFKKYIQDHGVTDARTTENWGDIPKGTLIKFGFDGANISSYTGDLKGQKQYPYIFDIIWSGHWRDNYEGLFEVEESSAKADNQKELRISVKTQKEWNAVVKKMLDDPRIGEWMYGNKQLNSEFWNSNKENTIIYSRKKNDYKITYSDDYHTNIPLQSAQQYLGYDPNMLTINQPNFSIGDDTRNPSDMLRVANRIWTSDVTDECIKNKLYISFNQLTKPKGNKYMSIISNTFKSKENKALEYFGLGTTETLSEQGREEFIDFLWETLKEEKKAFLSKIVEAHKEEK